MKKMLFMLINMNVGGTEKALLNMLAEIPRDQYEITILMLEEYGGFRNNIPGDVHIEYIKGYKKISSVLNKPPKVAVLNLLEEGKVVTAVILALLSLISKIINDRRIIFKYILKDYPVISQDYDVAVAFAGPMEFITYYILHKTVANKKVQWVHFDVTKIGFNKKFASKTFNNFDKIFAVSDEGKNKLVNMLPEIKEKTEKFSNIVSPELIMKMANEGIGFEDSYDGIRILTVGRLSDEKGQDIAVAVLARLKAEGHMVRWYCIGEGKSRGKYEQLIKRYDLEKDFILLGTKLNPYPFMKQCDIYVQPSRHEGYCITLAEARCLYKPIITTNFAGAREQIVNGKTGLVVSPNEKEIYDAVVKLLNHDFRTTFSEKLIKEKIDTVSDMEKIYSLFDIVE